MYLQDFRSNKLNKSHLESRNVHGNCCEKLKCHFTKEVYDRAVMEIEAIVTDNLENILVGD